MYIVKLKNGNITTEIHGTKEKLKSGSVVKGINSIDSFSFSVLPSNAGFDKIHDYLTLVSVYNTNKKRYEFQGRVLYSSRMMDSSGKISKDVVCESYLGFLCDSVQEYVYERNWTVKELLGFILNQHNSQVEEYKKIAIGEVTVTDPNDNLYLGIQRNNSWKTIEEKLIKKLGGEIRFRVEDGVIYLDYLKEIGERLTTEIALSKNMKSITREDNPSDYITRLIPLGCKLKNEDGEETEERLDIASVNDGKNYIENEAAAKMYGIRYGYVTYDDVTIPSNLLSKGKMYLQENSKVKVKYSITALDLSLLKMDINDFDVCNYHPIKNRLLGIDDVARVIKKTIDICEEVKSTIEVGDNFKSLSDLQVEKENAIRDAETKIENTKTELKDYVSNKVVGSENQLRETITEQYTKIMNDSNKIIMSAVESYMENSDYTHFKETVESQLQVLSDTISMKFTQTTEKLDEVNGELQEKFNNITKYFTFNIDGLTIGQVDNPYKMILNNNRLSMTVGDTEVMWIEDGKVYTQEIQVTKEFRLFDYIINKDDHENINCAYVGRKEGGAVG